MPTLAPDATASFSPGQDRARDVLSGEDNRFSCLVGGTRSGKTFLIVRNILIRALKGAGSRHAILRFRGNAARQAISLDTLPAVARKCFPGLPMKEHRQDGFFDIPNGSQIYVGGLDDKDRVEKILGLEFATIFLNEASQIPYNSALIAFTRLAQVVPGLKQRAYVDLNPVGKSHWTNRLFGEHVDPISRRPLPDPENYQRAFLNPIDNAHNLSPEFIAGLANMPEKHRKRFYEGVYVDEVDGALWTYELLEKTRVDPADIPEHRRARVVIAIDPSGASGRDDLGADEIGIVAACKGQDGHGYVLEDLSVREGPATWARIAVTAYHRLKADCIVAEGNFGGEMVRQTIKSVDPNVPVHLVTASRGKAVRAEPIAALSEREHMHLAGHFPKLEEQLCSFATNGYQGADSPDHADAAIWALTHLMLGESTTGIIEFYERQAREKAEAGPPKGPQIGPGEATGGLVAMLAPPDVSTAYGRSGRRYDVVAGRVEVEADDVGPFRAAGFREVDP